MLMALRTENAPPDQKLPTVPEIMSFKGRGVIFVCPNKVRCGPASAEQSQSKLELAKPAAVCMACLKYTDPPIPTPPPLTHLFS